MCRFCEFPFDADTPMMDDGGFDYFGYGMDADGNLCFVVEIDWGDGYVEQSHPVGPSNGLPVCAFCGRVFEDGENYAEERALQEAARHFEGSLVATFEDGTRIERPFLYRSLPYGNADAGRPAEIAAFADDADAYDHISESELASIEAYDQDDTRWEAQWLPTTSYGRFNEIKNKGVFYFTDTVFWA